MRARMGRCLRGVSFAAAGVILSTSVQTAGCARTNPDQLAASAVQAIVQADRIDFQGQSHTEVDGFALPPQPAVEGRMSAGKQVALAYRSDTAANRDAPGGEAPVLRWNLQPWLERYPQLKLVATMDDKESDKSTRAVKVKLDPAEVKKLIASELLVQRGAVKERVAAALSKPPRSLSAAQAERLRSELQTVAAQQSVRLDEMLNSMQADGALTLWLDRAGNRPQRLSLETRLRYRSEGRQRTETGTAVYTFGEGGSGKLLPAP